MHNIQDLKLLHQKCYLAGEWVGASDGGLIDVANPATGEVIGSVPNMGREATKYVIKRAKEAWDSWRKQVAKERAGIMQNWHSLILENIEELSLILTWEQGKPLAQAKGEILNGLGFIELYLEEAKRIYGDVIPASNTDSRIMVIKQPVGVVALITPWNFPSSMIMRKAAAALAAGCPVVIKPSELTPFSALALADLAEKAGFPEGIFNVITGAPEEIGDEFCKNIDVRKLSFTGSTKVGKLLAEKSADNLKKLSLELGGNAPFIVFEDADLKSAITGVIISKFRNSGQTCICANRIFVHIDVYDGFIGGFLKEATSLKIGNGLKDDVDLGPMINKEAVSKGNNFIDDAIAKGGKLLLGGKSDSLFFAPTIITNASPDMLCFSEEIFAPIAVIYKFNADDEALEMANNTLFGLAAYMYTNNITKSV